MITNEAIERRIKCLEFGNNDYFKQGMETACKKAKANGFTIKPFDANNYPYLDQMQVWDQSRRCIPPAYSVQKTALARLTELQVRPEVKVP